MGTFAQRRRWWTKAAGLVFALLPTTMCAQQPTTQEARLIPVAAYASPASDVPSTMYSRPYRIGPGDELGITYPYHPELNHAGPVGPDGRLSLPFIGSVLAGGRTSDELSAEISRALLADGIAANAYPNVQVTKYGYGNAIYVGGEVGKPGLIPLETAMDPLQAIVAAGGFLESAHSGKVAIIHRTASGEASVTYLDVHAYLAGKLGAHTVELAPYDVVYVPKTKIAEVDQWIDAYINKTLPFGRSFNYNAGSYGNEVVTGK